MDSILDITHLHTNHVLICSFNEFWSTLRSEETSLLNPESDALIQFVLFTQLGQISMQKFTRNFEQPTSWECPGGAERSEDHGIVMWTSSEVAIV